EKVFNEIVDSLKEEIYKEYLKSHRREFEDWLDKWENAPLEGFFLEKDFYKPEDFPHSAYK
ncbi:MAG: hypothetical protein Q4C83_03285, partial [Candidatus Saccharibacteria bacterium]|nr:hypothetical protein [Candidatus Saccharibacteria bacterium]